MWILCTHTSCLFKREREMHSIWYHLHRYMNLIRPMNQIHRRRRRIFTCAYRIVESSLNRQKEALTKNVEEPTIKRSCVTTTDKRHFRLITNYLFTIIILYDVGIRLEMHTKRSDKISLGILTSIISLNITQNIRMIISV